MARQLLQSQIKILERFYQKNHTIDRWDDLPQEVRERLEELNDYETLWSDTERWLSDRFFDEKYGGNNAS